MDALQNNAVFVAMLLFYLWWLPAAAAVLAVVGLFRPRGRLFAASALALSSLPPLTFLFAERYPPAAWRSSLAAHPTAADFLAVGAVYAAGPIAVAASMFAARKVGAA